MNTRFGLVPPLGETLNPFRGLWWRAVPIYESRSNKVELKAAGLLEPVIVKVDTDQIKHIFAKNDHDLYFAQGYVLASERLWQMEFMSRAGAGRLSEIFGEKTLEADRFFRKMGIAAAAQQSVDMMMSDSVTGPALTAYTEGVNAYIDQLDERDFPFEYRFLGHKPEKWNASNAANLLKFMAWNLSGHSKDIALTRSFLKLGRKGFAELFPLRIGSEEPVVPQGTTWNFSSRNPPIPNEIFEPTPEKLTLLPMPDPSNGSNSWAVTSKKSTTGLPILSNDIHLNYTLPSLWYEMQLVSPTQNVYGIAMPGAPGIIVGFNKKVAWGVTNGGTDILDWFELRYRDEKRSEYLFDGGWRPVISQDTEILVRDKGTHHLLLRETHFGPIVYDESEQPYIHNVARGLAMRWGALVPSNELKTFLLLNRASTVSECRGAIDTYSSPSQNFLCIDSAGDTGLWHMGRFPVRWEGQGRLVGDGSNKSYDWSGWIPSEEVPMVKQPARGFLSSANQWPTDSNYPHYIGSQFESPFRSMRINEILRSKPKFSPEDFVKMQADTVSLSTKAILPLMMSYVKTENLNSDEQVALAVLRSWDFTFRDSTVPPSIAGTWIRKFEQALWNPHFEDAKTHAYPSIVKTVELVKNDPYSHWFDDPSTDTKETLPDLVTKALKEAMKELRISTNRSDITRWHWGTVRQTRVDHIGRIPGLGDAGIKAGGSETAIFANKSTHGPVWKMVVAVGPKPEAWTIYPGGQSGDPMSPHYDDFIEDWKIGKLKKVNFLLSEIEENARLKMEISIGGAE